MTQAQPAATQHIDPSLSLDAAQAPSLTQLCLRRAVDFLESAAAHAVDEWSEDADEQPQPSAYGSNLRGALACVDAAHRGKDADALNVKAWMDATHKWLTKAVDYLGYQRRYHASGFQACVAMAPAWTLCNQMLRALRTGALPQKDDGEHLARCECMEVVDILAGAALLCRVGAGRAADHFFREELRQPQWDYNWVHSIHKEHRAALQGEIEPAGAVLRTALSLLHVGVHDLASAHFERAVAILMKLPLPALSLAHQRTERVDDELLAHHDVLKRRVERIFMLRAHGGQRKHVGETEIQGAVLATMSACLTMLNRQGAGGKPPDWEQLIADDESDA